MLRVSTCLAGSLALVLGIPATAATLSATAANLGAVFAAAKAGDTIRLTGTFGRVFLSNRSFTTAVTLDARAASFTDALSLSGIDNVRLLGGKYGNAAASAAAGIRIYGSSRILVSAPRVVGNGTSSHGIDVGSSSGITVDRGSFTGLKLGVGFTAVTNGRITGNTSVRASSDGFNVVDSHNVLVSRNSCSGTAIYNGAHPDCVQMWSVAGHAPQSDIEISDNVATGATQGFTSFDGAAGGGDRLKFLRNRVDTSYPQGIACYECRNSQFIGNIVTTLPGSQWRTSINVFGGSGNIISGNSVAAYRRAAALDETAFEAFDAPADPDSFDRFAAQPAVDALAPVGAGGVPEPAAWALMLAGFGAVGGALRRRRAVSA